MEDEQLPILFKKIGLNKKTLELSFITCWRKTPDCWQVKDLTIFSARKTQTGVLIDKIILFALTPLNSDSVFFFLQKPTSNYYKKNVNKLISFKVNLSRYDFIYFDSREYCLTELDLKSMKSKIKGFKKK